MTKATVIDFKAILFKEKPKSTFIEEVGRENRNHSHKTKVSTV